MNRESVFPGYIPREEQELQIRRILANVRADQRSRAVLLYGEGGVGKTSLVRHVSEALSDQRTTCLGPFDADDPSYWLLSNLERVIADRLDPENKHFALYRAQVRQLPSDPLPSIRQDTVTGHLGRVKQDFADCYERCTGASGQTVVLVFDTVEAVRGNLLQTLTQWIKGLPSSTLFILSGRPMPDSSDAPDPIAAELSSRDREGLLITEMRLGRFSRDAAARYLNSSPVSEGLGDEEKAKLIHLTRGHPLWMAFTLDYLRSEGIPAELDLQRPSIEAALPYGQEPDRAGQALYESFLRRLVAPYRETDFMHEAIKRLAAVRQGVNQDIFTRLMQDRRLPAALPDDAAAWNALLDCPWVRRRAGGRYVTLHDAVAEALAQRIFPVHDQDQAWRRQLWRRAADIYTDLLNQGEPGLDRRRRRLEDNLSRIDRQLRDTGEHQRRRTGEHERPVVLDVGHPARHAAIADEQALIKETERMDLRHRELDTVKAARLYYLFLCDFDTASAELLRLMEQARKDQDFVFFDLLAQELQRFLPGEAPAYAPGDVTGPKVAEFHEWLTGPGREQYLAVSLMLAEFLIENERPEQALQAIKRLPAVSDPLQRYQLSILHGNACMRIPQLADEAEEHFRNAEGEAEALDPAEHRRLGAQISKELGFYHRNTGQWQAADADYQRAFDALTDPSADRTSGNNEELASVLTNWAYVKGLTGSYTEGVRHAQLAIRFRHDLKLYLEEGISWSVCGEVQRYAGRFEQAQEAYAVAERLFDSQRNWAWLGVIYQQQAICLFQARQASADIVADADSAEHARYLIRKALDVCRKQNVRAYPSALNRAGRIFGQDDPDEGLRYLAEGIDAARDLSDSWFWFANLIEYLELSYQAWTRSADSARRASIESRGAEINQVRASLADDAFPDLQGRWSILRGHIGIGDYVQNLRRRDLLDAALNDYTDGFSRIAQSRDGSYGSALLSAGFRVLGETLGQLPAPDRADVMKRLGQTWRSLGKREVSNLLMTGLAGLRETGL
jgi:tetratricopeptide (TPR) repeat protein